MIEKRPKLRLRKQVIISIPVLLLIVTLTTFLVLNRNNKNEYTVSPNDVATALTDEIVGTKLSELKTISNFGDRIDKRQKDNTIIYYASLYDVKIDVALDTVHTLTNNYTDPTFLEKNIIGGTNIINRIGSLESFEAGVVYFIKDFYSYPERYNKTISEVRNSEYPNPVTKVVSSDGNIYMDNGMTFEQYMAKISNLFGIDPSLALAICYQESGIKKSGLFTISNNIGGHKGYDGWMSFPTLEAGVIHHVITLKNLYNKFNIDPKDQNNISVLSGIYVHGVPGTIADHWLSKVLYFKEDINSKDLFNPNK